MDIWQSLNGVVAVELTSADPAADLRTIRNIGIELHQVVRLDDLSFRFRLRRQDLNILRQRIAARGGQLKVVESKGLYWFFSGLVHRPVLIMGVMIIFFFALFLPTRVYFFRVTGNATIPEKLILEKAAECGLTFGASRKDIRSERVKNALLAAIPELQWVGVNTSGCVATISVRERQNGENLPENRGVSSIVALRDGIIEECTVTKGSSVCKVGQAVKAGQVLISGYTDSGITLRGERAEGEIFALTDRSIDLITPLDWQIRGEQTEEKRKISLVIGKNQINFSESSGNLHTECAKMYEVKYLTLPGGFQLPIGIVIETWISYDQQREPVSGETSASQMSRLAEDYLKQQMIAGQILTGQEALTQNNGILRLQGNYSCREMIGREQNEEIITP